MMICLIFLWHESELNIFTFLCPPPITPGAFCFRFFSPYTRLSVSQYTSMSVHLTIGECPYLARIFIVGTYIQLRGTNLRSYMKNISLVFSLHQFQYQCLWPFALLQNVDNGTSLCLSFIEHINVKRHPDFIA